MQSSQILYQYGTCYRPQTLMTNVSQELGIPFNATFRGSMFFFLSPTATSWSCTCVILYKWLVTLSYLYIYTNLSIFLKTLFLFMLVL
jgi:hypothetical protein